MLLQHSLLHLWTTPPGALGTTPEDIPVLTAILPTPGMATGSAIIVCPGGGYRMLADYEGPLVGDWLAAHGITAFVLRYRLGPTYRYPTQRSDAQRAIRFVRAHAEEWQLDPQRIGILGFSAGGHLSSMTATHFTSGTPDAVDPVERVSSRPDLQVLIYPVISFHVTYTPVRSLLGGDPHPAPSLLDELSTDKHVTGQTPPAFLAHSTKDTIVPVENADLYAASLAREGIEYRYIREDLGEHGIGIDERWTVPCIDWLRSYQF